jgi:hypothetical protein
MIVLVFRRRRLFDIGLVACLLALNGCSGNLLSRKYEYEEDVYLRLDASATVYINAAVPALIALRGVDLPLDPKARLDRLKVRELYEAPGARVGSVTLSRRDNRRYVHLRLEVADVRTLDTSPPLAWSAYGFDRQDGLFEYRQIVGAAAGRAVASVGWDGTELAAFRLHLPSRVVFHNSPSKTIRRGNIIEWEQPLADRMKGLPVDIRIQMETESILVRTMTLFGLMALAVAATFAGVIWWVRSRAGRAGWTGG